MADEAPTTREGYIAEAARIIAQHAGDPIEWSPMDGTQLQPLVLPFGWNVEPRGSAFEPRFYTRGTSQQRLLVAMSAMRHDTHGEWLHVSASYRDRVPPWPTMCEIKDLFIGPDRVAIQLHPRRSAHANLHPHCLHLWARLDRDAAPDFRTRGMI